MGRSKLLQRYLPQKSWRRTSEFEIKINIFCFLYLYFLRLVPWTFIKFTPTLGMENLKVQLPWTKKPLTMGSINLWSLANSRLYVLKSTPLSKSSKFFWIMRDLKMTSLRLSLSDFAPEWNIFGILNIPLFLDKDFRI